MIVSDISKIKKLFKIMLIPFVAISFNACGGGGSSGKNNAGSNPNNTVFDKYSYIPKGKELTDRMAVKFLNMATMGATPELVKELKQKGVVNWVNEQLAKKWDYKKESVVYNMMHDVLKMRPYAYCEKANIPIPKTEDEIEKTIQIFLEDNDKVFNRTLIHGADELAYHSSAIFNGHINDDAQLRQKVAYALSQIAVASESTDFFFKHRGEALSYYYDFLLKDAFDNYGKLLYDVTKTPAMATYLTYANNKKAYIDKNTGLLITPDENYGREIMQLFTIGLFEMNMDGSFKRKNGKRIPTYDQKTVMEVSRVFTGLGYPHPSLKNRYFSATLWMSDSLHPMVCYNEYHDMDEKHFLGKTLPGGQDCYKDINDTINILIHHPNTAPFIAKKLILRLTKSNPKPDYIKRVAQAFKNSNGNLGETVKAVLLDPEIWDDIKNDRGTKIKEPYLAFTQMLRGLNVTPWPKRTVVDDDNTTHIIENRFFVPSRYKYLNEWPTYSPSVFNFYSDDYQPDSDEFKIKGFVAPEAQILTTKYMISITNHTFHTLQNQEFNFLYEHNDEDLDKLYKEHRAFFQMYLLLNFDKYINYFKKPGNATLKEGILDENGRAEAVRKIVNEVSLLMLGKYMPKDFVDKIVETYKNKISKYSSSWDEARIRSLWVTKVIAPVITEIVMNQENMVQ